MSAHATHRESEREGLQALLRGASECLALLPPSSPRVVSARVLQEGLIQILSNDPNEED